jgi:hypothetical protein
MLTNPIRGKAGKQIAIASAAAAGQVMYTVPAGKYFETPNLPGGIIVTANGVSSSATTGTAVSTVFQAGTVITSSGATNGFFGTEYDA